uniref:Uncharacterized protein n=1 Tax=mine drainage metagenome TaxID=410659 RepID=E6PZE3_9ZZZZ
MAQGWQEQFQNGSGPSRSVELSGLVREATESLVRMDADRLEELARCCRDLNREPAGMIDQRVDQRLATQDSMRERTRELARELTRQRASMDVFARLLVETRANLRVLSHLHALRLRASGMGEFALSGLERSGRKVGYGDN